MKETLPSELQEWDEILKMAGTGNPDSNPTGQHVRTAQKLVLAIVNLQEAIINHQAKTARRLEQLALSIDRFNENSGRLTIVGLALSSAIVLAAIAQVLIAIVKH